MLENETPAHVTPSWMGRKILIIVSFGLWLLSLSLPTLVSPSESISGIMLLLAGWLGPIGAGYTIGTLAWWANPFYLWALLKINNRKSPSFSSTAALLLSTLTVFVHSYAVNAVPVFTPVIGYGPGALFWYISILCLWCVVAQDNGKHPVIYKGVFVLAGTIFLLFMGQIAWRAVYANASEKEKLPIYVAKRGMICSMKSLPLPVTAQQPALQLELAQSEMDRGGLRDSRNRQWLSALHGWNVAAIQFEGIEYRDAPEGSPESSRPPFMILGQITAPARYTLRVEGGPPYTNNTQFYSETVQLTIIDNYTEKEVGHLIHNLEKNSLLGYCPQLTPLPRSYKSVYQYEEVRKWLAPFIMEP